MHSFRRGRAFADPAAGLPNDPIHYKLFFFLDGHWRAHRFSSAIRMPSFSCQSPDLSPAAMCYSQGACIWPAVLLLVLPGPIHSCLMCLACSHTSGSTYPAICRSRQFSGYWNPAGISIAGLGLLASEAPVSLVGWQLSISAAPSVLQPVTTLCVMGDLISNQQLWPPNAAYVDASALSQ